MRTPSGELHVVDFKTEQIVASIQPIDYWDDKRHWEIKNNIDTLEFHVLDNTRHSSTLMQQNLVLKEVRDGRIVPYVITEIEKNSDDRSVIAYASGEWIQLAKAGIIPPQKLEGKTVIEMVDIALAGTKWKKGNLEYASFRSMTIDEFIDPLSFLKKIASLFELEIQYRAEVVGSQVVGRYVDMVKKRGQETGKEITLGKDLMGIKRIENSQNICTALLGFVKKEGGEFITITEINNGVPYLVDNDAFQRWNEKGNHKFGFYSPETENDDMDAKRLMTLMNTELKKRVNSSVFYEVEAQSIGRVFGLSHELINEGDTIRIKDTGFTPKLYLEARAIAGDESFKNPLQDKYVFGDYHEIVDPNEELRKIYNRILSSLGNKQEMIDQLDKLVKEANETASNAKKESEAAKVLAEKVQENIKNNTVEIIESKNPPTTGFKPFKTLWRDISNGKPGILKIWTGTAWESVVPDVESVKKETLEQVNIDIESAKTELNQKVKEAETKADNLQKDFNAVKGEQERVSQVTKALEESDKGTKETIKSLQGNQESMSRTIVETSKGVEGLKNTVSDIKKDQSGITDRVVKTEQNINGISSSIEQINKTSSQTIQKLNQVEQDANGTKQTIERVEKTVNAIDTDVVNLVRGTKMLTFKDELEARGGLFKNGDTFNGNIVVDIPGSWHGIAIRLQKLYEQGKIKIGDFVTYSVFTRIKGAPDGVVMKQSMYDGFGGWEVTSATNQWKQVGNTIQLKDNHIGKDSLFRIEAWEVSGGDKGYVYQQTSPMLSISKKLYPWRPAPEDQADSGEFIKTTTEIIQEAGRTKETMTQMKSRVDNLDVGVSNLVINSSCDNEKPQMFDQPGESQVGGVDDIRYYEKHLAIKCNRHTDAFYQIGGYEKSLHGLEPGKEVTISADINCESVDYHFEMFYTTNAEGSNWRAFVGELYKELKIWKRRSFTFKIPNDTTSIMFRIYFGRVVTSNGTWLNFKNVQIERGNIATGYKRAYQDQVTTDEFTKKTTEITKSVDGIKETITKVENNQSGFDKRVATVEKDATTIKQNVSLIQNTQTEQGRQLQEAKAGWENTAKALEGKVELKQVEDYVAGFKIPELKQTVNQNKQDLLNELANKLATEQFNQKMTLIDNRFTINEQGINAAAKKTEVYTKTQADGQFATDSYVRDMEARLQLTEKGVSISVKENDVIAAINMSKENIKLNAARIDLIGKVNAEWIKAGLLSGCQIRTSNTNNYVSLDDQFVRLYESGVARAFLGYYRRQDGAVQPTFILGSDERTNAPEGTLFMSQAGAGWPGAYASIGISDGIVDGSVQKSVYWELQRNGISVLNANDYQAFYTGNGNWYFRRGKPGLYQTSLVLEDNGSDADLRLPNITLRNSRVAGYTGIIQVKSSVTQNGWGSVQGNFMSPSLREYKSNIRDVSFSALEKIRSLKIRQFNYKNAVNELYRMREEKSPNDPPLTTEDIKTYYGAIVDECDEVFIDESGKGIHLYSYASIGIKGLQEVDATVQEQAVEIANLKSQVANQENRIVRLEELLQQLIDEKPEQP